MEMVEQSAYLHVTARGLRSRESVREVSLQSFRRAKEIRVSKLLVDVRELEGEFGVLEILLLVREVLAQLRGQGVERAAVIDVHRTSRDDWFLDPVARSYGLNIRVFTEMEPAVDWLKG
jgi:hypothetical protein